MNTDKATSIFWLFISIIVSVASFRLGLGKLSIPGSGFMPFGAAVLLGMLSIVCFLQAMGQKKPTDDQPLFRGYALAEGNSGFCGPLCLRPINSLRGLQCDHLFA